MGINLELDPETFRPLIEAAAAEAVARVGAVQAQLNGKLAFSEPEAARLLSLEPHQLRDERRRGRIMASVGPGRKILYSREDLLAYLASRRWKEPEKN